MLVPRPKLAELTGRPHAKRQIEWLTRHGWTFEIGDDNRPKVSQAYFDKRMGGEQQTRRWEPDLSKI